MSRYARYWLSLRAWNRSLCCPSCASPCTIRMDASVSCVREASWAGRRQPRNRTPRSWLIMEPHRQTLHMREEIAPNREDKVLSDSTHRSGEVVGQEARHHGDQQGRGARAEENRRLAEPGAVQPC